MLNPEQESILFKCLRKRPQWQVIPRENRKQRGNGRTMTFSPTAVTRWQNPKWASYILLFLTKYTAWKIHRIIVIFYTSVTKTEKVTMILALPCMLITLWAFLCMHLCYFWLRKAINWNQIKYKNKTYFISASCQGNISHFCFRNNSIN